MALDFRAMKKWSAVDVTTMARLRTACASLSTWTPSQHAEYADIHALEAPLRGPSDHVIGRFLLARIHPRVGPAIAACAAFYPAAVKYGSAREPMPPTTSSIQSLSEIAAFARAHAEPLAGVLAEERPPGFHASYNAALATLAAALEALAGSLPKTL